MAEDATIDNPGMTGRSSAIAAGGFWANLVRYAVLNSHRSGIHAERLLAALIEWCEENIT